MFMQSDAIQLKVTEPIATVVLNRPERRNALTRAMIVDLREMLRDLYQEKRVRAIVLTGAGDAFCSGRDVQEMVEPPPAEDPIAAEADAGDDQPAALLFPGIEPKQPEPAAEPGPPANATQWGDEASEYRDLILEMLELPKPIIASVNGPAAACGAGLVLASDLVVATPEARFGLPETRRGIVAGVAAPLVAFRFGAGVASRLLLPGDLLAAEEALRIGVYHELVAHDLLWARSADLGRSCAEAAPEAVGLTKRLLLETAGEQLATQLTSGAIAAATSRTTDVAREGLAAFLDKRPPSWLPGP